MLKNPNVSAYPQICDYILNSSVTLKDTIQAKLKLLSKEITIFSQLSNRLFMCNLHFIRVQVTFDHTVHCSSGWALVPCVFLHVTPHVAKSRVVYLSDADAPQGGGLVCRWTTSTYS